MHHTESTGAVPSVSPDKTVDMTERQITVKRVTTIEAVYAADIRSVESLLRDYALWMRRRYLRQPAIIDDYLDPLEWQSELSDLQGHYGAPHGAIVLALVGSTPAGCVLMRGVGEETCELRRLFVRPAFRRLGVGSAMAAHVMGLACVRRYSDMWLDVGPLQQEAVAFYRDLGFSQMQSPVAHDAYRLARFAARPCEWSRPGKPVLLRAG